jgi:hypothetical protein
MDPTKISRISKNRVDARALLEDARIKESKEEKADLDDPKTQESIMTPTGTIIEIGGEKVRLYPVSGATARRLVGMANQLFASASGPGSPGLRIGGALVEGYLDRFLPILAESTFPDPTQIKPELMRTLIKKFDVATQSVRGAFELAAAFNEILSLNGVMDFFGQKVKEAETETEIKTTE